MSVVSINCICLAKCLVYVSIKNVDLVCTTRFWSPLWYLQNRKIAKSNNLRIPKGLNRITKIGQGHLCLREEKLSYNNNYRTLSKNCKYKLVYLSKLSYIYIYTYTQWWDGIFIFYLMPWSNQSYKCHDCRVNKSINTSHKSFVKRNRIIKVFFISFTS